MGILFLHDLGHVYVIKRLGYQINSIEVLPFGGNIKTNIGLNSNSKDIFLISIAGVGVQFILFFVVFIFYKLSLIDIYSFEVFFKYNLFIMLFNLLPIYPLDGLKVVSSFLEIFVSFRLSLIISYVLSFVFIFIFLYFNYKFGFDNYLIISFLFCKLILYIREHKYILNKFYVERYLSNNKYNKVKYIGSLKGLRKNYFNFIKNESEKKVLERKLKYFI